MQSLRTNSNRLAAVSMNVVVTLLWLMAAIPVFPQISPGELSAPHAKLEGLSNCTHCHVLGSQVTNQKCLDCHKEINYRISNNRGYHASKEVSGKNCFACHSEHHGRKFRIINFKPDGFDHAKTGYPLQGVHASKKCNDCHKPDNISDAGIRKRKDTFLGLSNRCSGCHEDKHQGTLDSDCAKCHDEEKFKPAARFDHKSARFKLTGAHLQAICTDCHAVEKRNGKDFQKFRGIKFDNCNACHKDPHANKFGQDCQHCHVTASFRKVDNTVFDHGKTGFPLQGEHLSLDCKSCHKQGVAVKLKHTKCTDCHKDFHKGQFIRNNAITDCAMCHTVSGFSPSTYIMAEHAELKFRLLGAHRSVACVDCHKKGDDWRFRNLDTECAACHKNPHGSEITQEFMPANKCDVCHTPDTWDAVTFDHNRARFKLEAKHSLQTCAVCHTTKIESGARSYKFSTLGSACETCHKDVHAGQFRQEGRTDCAACHRFYNWQAVAFDHAKTRFSLTGAHEKVPCAGCHKRKEENGNVFINYKVNDFKCASCHSR